ncbi:MAG: diguanylate cyclase [Nitrospiraceae bacterium]|nr:diguanylate cyclase [Nitrospiraceae bacterium]
MKIGILSFRPKPQTLAQWQPLAKALKHAMPERDFVIKPLTYPELNKAVAEKQLDFVFTNPGHFVQLKVKGGLSAPLATLAVDLGGRRFSVFGGSILSRAGDARINTLKDIRGRTIAVPDTESLGGYQMQAYELFLTGISLPKDAKLMITGMPHDNVVKAVIDGRADVGFVRSGVIEGMVREGKLDLKQLKILNLQNLPDFPYKVSTRLYPEWPFSALVDTDEKLARRVAAALFTLEESNASFLPDGIHSFSVPANYTPMEEMLRELRFPPFDAAPSFTVWDIWERYRWQILAALIALTAISLLGVRLMLTKRKLEAEKIIVSVQSQKLQESEEHLRTILDTEPECISIIDADGMIISMNPAGLSMIEADSQEQVIGRSVFDMIAPEYHAAYKDMHEKVIAGNKMKLEFEVLSLKEGRRMLETHAAPMYDRNRVVHIGVTRDISERKKLEKQLQQMAHYDMLTNLPNRTLFSDRFQQALTLAKRNDKLLAIMFIDLDRFKPVNDTYGHRVGDLLLQEVALRIKGCIRESDTVARVGGDEFIALLQNIRGAQEAKAVAEKIRDTLYQPYNISGHVLDISSSIGIAVFPENGKDETELSRNADMAMYDAKKKGRNAVQLFQETT